MFITKQFKFVSKAKLWRSPGSSVGQALAYWSSDPGFEPAWSGDLFNRRRHTNFQYHLPMVLIWLKYCWKGRKIASIHQKNDTDFRYSEVFMYSFSWQHQLTFIAGSLIFQQLFQKSSPKARSRMPSLIKVYSSNPGHMNNRDDTPIYGKNFENILHQTHTRILRNAMSHLHCTFTLKTQWKY